MDEVELPELELPVVRVHYDFRPIKIRVYKNGDENDLGKEINVTRREFKHWIVFLDALTKKLGTTTAINRMYTIHGERIDHFDDLQHKEEYVAAERGVFIPCEYGKYRLDRNPDKKWRSVLHVEDTQPVFLNSAETMDIYLKHEGYGSYTGLPYPFDAVMPNSPSHSAMHIHGHAHALGGSLEQLNKIGRPVYHDTKEHSKSDIHLPKLIGLEDTLPSEEKEKSSEEVTLPPLESKNEAKEPPAAGADGAVKDDVMSNRRIEITSSEKPAEMVEKKEEIKNEEKNPPIKVSIKLMEEADMDEEGRFIVPLLIPASKSPSKIPRSIRTDRSDFSHNYTEKIARFDDDDNFFERESNARKFTQRKTTVVDTFDADMDEVEYRRRGRGIEKIIERSERRIIRELSDDRGEIYKPARNIVKSTSKYKTYLWEPRPKYDPDFD